ncbi:MAG: hypothetical protein PHT44_04410 [Candidatus Portnoybacteria bacterium]|nr:hypothetical protein [Candidatus Portnoybacteria bacterium]MDD4983152.1 hypothetical protein [Candidatus Portnoybacteria bacterium]
MEKTRREFLSFIFACALTSSYGCGKNFLVKKDEKPTITREKTKDAKVLFLHRFPPTQEYKELGLSKGYTFYSAQKRIKKEVGEWKAFVNTENVVLRNYGAKNGKRKLYGPGHLKPGHIFFAKFVNEDADGNRIYRARFIGQCGNEIPDDDLMILETPVVITEKIVHLDTDYKPALWAGLGGLLLGLGLGYLFWFGTTKTVIASAGSACSTGGPVPR